jgi:hypothetical protein
VIIDDDGRVDTVGAAARRRTAIRLSDLAAHRRGADRVAA